MEENFTCTFNISGRGARNSSATINVGYDFVNSSTQENIFSGNKSFPCTTDEDGVLIYNGETTIPFKIENEVIQGRYTINVDCLISAVEENVTFTKNSITITPIKTVVWVEFNDYGELIDGDLSGLVNGSYMFWHTNVGQITNEDGTIQSKTFDYDLSSLVVGSWMFRNCGNLTSFTSDLPSLTNGDDMFWGCSNLTSFNSDLVSLKCGDDMFEGCKINETSLRNIADNINDLVEKGYDKDNDEDWTYEVLGETKTISKSDRGHIDIDLDSSVTQEVIIECGNKLINKGWDVYFNNTLYEYVNVVSPYDVSEANGYIPDAYKNESDSWNKRVLTPNMDLLQISTVNGEGEMLKDGSKVGIIEYDKLAIGQSLMQLNTYLSKWSCPLPSLTNGYQMFWSCTNLESFTSELPSLVDGYMMFYYCKNLTTFNSELPSLTKAFNMFCSCTNLESFTSELPSLVDGYIMFYTCKNLTSFTSALPNMVNCQSMFSGCENLTSFSSTLPSLKGAQSMFDDCKLDGESLMNIANNINNLKEKGYDKNVEEHWKYELLGETKTISSEGRARIDIGHGDGIEENVLRECADILIKKGWDAYFNDEKQKIYEFSNSILLRVERKRSSAMLDLWDTLYYGVLTFSGKRREGRGCTLTFTDSNNSVTFDTLALSPTPTTNVASGDLTLSVEGGTVTLTVRASGNTMTIDVKEYGGRANRVTITPYTQD